MTNTDKKYIYVFGSYRKYLKFKNFFNQENYTLIFISGESDEEESFIKTKDQLLAEFNSYYEKSQNIQAFISFAKGSLIGSIEAIAETFEVIKKEYPNCLNTEFIGPSEKAANIFCNKYLTYQALKNLNIPVPITFECLGDSVNEILNKIPDDIKFPVVLKAENLSGGRGIKYITDIHALERSIEHYYVLGINKFILSEYVVGIEATFTVIRLGDIFMRLPASYKNETTSEMIHPDAKVKISGAFNEFDEYFELVEKTMRKYEIFGFFSLQGVLLKNKDKYSVVFLEAAPRMTGSTPIMEASLVNFNIFKTIALWIKERKIEFGYTKRIALQYSSYIHNGKDTIVKLKDHSWVVESKYEDLSKIPYSEDNKNRIRISFFIENLEQLQDRLETISFVCNNKNYKKEVNDTLAYFSNNHPTLVEPIEKKVLEGAWGEDSRWEFCLSSTLPDKDLCTAVFCLPKVKECLLLTKTKRGWELPGGHIEESEDVIETLKRETLEEVGFSIQRAVLYGYRKVITSKILYNKEGKAYPYPISYIPHFIVTSDLEVKNPTGDDVLDNGAFSIKSLEVKDSHVREIIEVGYKEVNRIS